jgi:hypothetical protein
MELRFATHIFADVILRSAFPNEYDELLSTLRSIPIPLNPPAPFSDGRPKVPKRQRKTIRGANKYLLKPVSQKELNEKIAAGLGELGWTSQPVAAREHINGLSTAGLRGDFVKNKVFVEIEFGNVASSYRDIFKFLVARDNAMASVGVLVCATKRFGDLFDSGVASFESLERNIMPFLRLTPLPILFIGIDFDDQELRRLSRHYETMRAIAEENGVSCFTWEEAFQAIDVSTDFDEVISDEADSE